MGAEMSQGFEMLASWVSQATLNISTFEYIPNREGTSPNLQLTFTVILAVRRHPGRAVLHVRWQPRPQLNRKSLIDNSFLAVNPLARVLIPLTV